MPTIYLSMQFKQKPLKAFFCAVFITSASFFYNTKVTAGTCVPPAASKWGELPACFWNAVERYNTIPQSRVGYKAPYNYAQAIYPGQAPVKCTINFQHPYRFIYKISCADGYKYEIGTTAYCLYPLPGQSFPPNPPNCDKAIVISPSGQKTYHTHTWEKGECRCTTQGAEQVFLNRIFLGNKSKISTTPAKSKSAARGRPQMGDVLIIITHEFRE